MSYNPNIVRDSSNVVYIGGKPYRFQRVPAFNVMRDALITRRFGGKEPFWKRGLDWSIPKARKAWKYRKLFKYPAVPYPHETKKSKRFTRNSSSKLQKSAKLRTRKSCRCGKYTQRDYDRSGFCRCRSNRSYRPKRTYRKSSKVYRNTALVR